MAPAQVAVFFGSQSGTAECFSEELRDEASQHGITADVFDLMTFTPEAFTTKKIVVLVVATYGDGEPTDNAVDFNKWASNPASNGALAGQRFCVMALGDMNYTRFCQFGIDCDFNLERLGSKRIYERGTGDDSQDISADFKKWKEGGFWSSLKQAVAEVEAEGGFAEMEEADKTLVEVMKLPLYLYTGHEEGKGAAKDITEALDEKLKARGIVPLDQQCLSNRKACEVVKKMPKSGVALVIVDASPEGLCSSGKKLARNMNVEVDKSSLKEKGIRYLTLTVANSACCSSAAALKNQIQQNCAPIAKAFDKAGAETLNGRLPDYIDVGAGDPEPLIDELCKALCALSGEPVSTGQETVSAPIAQVTVAGPGPKTVLLCTGTEAREAAQALSQGMGNRCSVEDAALVSLAGAARSQTQVVLVVDCCEEGLSDGARGFVSQLSKAPLAIQTQLQKLKFALLTVVVTDVGNAGERANANAARGAIARATDPVSRHLAKFGANCVATACLDLQDATEESLVQTCEVLKEGFRASAEFKPAGTTAATRDGPTSARMGSKGAAPAPSASVESAAPAAGATEVRFADSAGKLPVEAEGEPADVVSRFYFDAEQAKVTKVKQLRQAPSVDEGLSTVEVELEATGNLKEYSLGGTLSLLPQNDPQDVNAVLPLFGLKPEDLQKPFTFVVGRGAKLKRPFPTPCTLGKALADYCDLARAPSKKMLAALQPKLQDADAKERVGKLLQDQEVLKMLHSSAFCCRMHEFWALLGITSLDLCDFLLHCPRQKPREFTIASSPKSSPGKITLCVSLTSHKQADFAMLLTKLREADVVAPGAHEPRQTLFLGVCSSWLNSRLKTGDVVLAKQRPSALKLPEKDVPVIMIGAGAGVAPFRGFWEELRKGPQSAPAVLFFGCRHPEKDWLFKDEMNGAVKLRGNTALSRMQVGPKRPLAALYPAFSRPDEKSEKKYVQDLIKEQSSMVKAGIEKDGVVYICGSSAMGHAALEALADAIEGGAAAVEEMRKSGRIVAEMWG